MKHNTTLTWTAAEQLCSEMNSHLLSIQSSEEMMFIHATLVERGITSQGVYIGEKDRDQT